MLHSKENRTFAYITSGSLISCEKKTTTTTPNRLDLSMAITSALQGFLSLYLLLVSASEMMNSSEFQEFHVFTSNSSSPESWLEFHVKFCGRVCHDGELKNLNYCSDSRCFPCNCGPECSIYDTCCPQMVNTSFFEPKLIENNNLPKFDRFQCERLPYDSSNTMLYIISDCGANFINSAQQNSDTLLEYSTRCQNLSMKTMDDITPYSDMYYGIVFKNKFCALCNGYTINSNKTSDVTNTSAKIASPWSLEVSCEHFQQLYHLTSELEFISTAAYTESCNILFMSPSSQLSPQVCSNEVQVLQAESCESSDEITRQLCLNISRRSLRFGNYSSIFCQLCADDRITRAICSVTPASAIHRGLPRVGTFSLYEAPIKMLLGVTNRYRYSQSDQNCKSPLDWPDYQGECRTANCSSGKIATKDGHCSTALSGIRGLGYKLALTLVPIDEVTITPNETGQLHDAFYRKTCSYSDNNSTELNTNVTVIINTDGSSKLHTCTIWAHIVTDKEIQRDVIERKFLELAANPWVIDLELGYNSRITLKPSILGTEIVGLIDSSSNVNSTKTFSWETKYQHQRLSTGYSNKAYNYSGPIHTPALSKIWFLKEDFIDITYSLLCPFVSANISEVSPYANGLKLSFLYHGRKFDIIAGPNISVVNGTLRVCLDTFKVFIKGDMTISLPIIILYYFQVICFLLSIVCLVVSSVTYFLFRVLRSLPGLNNMGLCVSMATAQICLLVTVEYGVTGLLPYGYCMFQAILLHYSWLASFAWMSACCIHMYVAFTSCNAPSNSGSSDRRRFTRYCFYAFGVPAVIVALNVVLNLCATSGASFGYDTTVCFIDTRKSILTFALSLIFPLCALVVTNGVMFALTLREIMHIARIQKATTKVERQGVMTYVKLSTLTGIFCVISAAAVWLDNIVLQFLTCPLMALQGVFIFFSFIFTRRVYKLYFDLLGLQRLGFSLTTQGVSGTTSSTQDTKKRKHYIHAKTDSTSM